VQGHDGVASYSWLSDLGVGWIAERPGNLLLDFEHLRVTFRLVVVEGDRQVGKEDQHLVLAEPQALQEVAHRRLFHPSALAGPSLGRWIDRMPCGEQRGSG
jgi:hypothetical protein